MITKNLSNWERFSEEDLKTAAAIMSEIVKHLKSDSTDCERVHDHALDAFRNEVGTMEEAFALAFSEFLINFKPKGRKKL